MSQVALWWARYHTPDYEIYASEREAAGVAWGMTDSGGAAILGVQFPDGRTIARDDWEMLRQVTEEYDAAYAARVDPPAPPQREIRDPFSGRQLKVDEDEPSWLGTPKEARLAR